MSTSPSTEINPYSVIAPTGRKEFTTWTEADEWARKHTPATLFAGDVFRSYGADGIVRLPDGRKA